MGKEPLIHMVFISASEVLNRWDNKVFLCFDLEIEVLINTDRTIRQPLKYHPR